MSLGDAGTVEVDASTGGEVTVGDDVVAPGLPVELGIAVELEMALGLEVDEPDDEVLEFTFVVLLVGPGSSTNVTGGLTPTRLSCAATGDNPKEATRTAPNATAPNPVIEAHLTGSPLRPCNRAPELATV